MRLTVINSSQHVKLFAFLFLSLLASGQEVQFGNSLFEISVQERGGTLWTLNSRGSNHLYRFNPPAFEIDGQLRVAVPTGLRELPARQIGNGITERRFSGSFAGDPGLALQLIFRVADHDPVVRFCYRLQFSLPRALTRTGQADNLEYLRTSFSSLPRVTEVRLSEFNEITHSYTPSERNVPESSFRDNLQMMGPIVVGEDAEGGSLLLAYEHGSTTPDAFLQFQMAPSRQVSLRAVKGNYVPGQKITEYETVWMDVGVTAGGIDSAAAAFRTHLLRWMTPQLESRRPYIFYNTWNFQERNKWWNGKPYLASMTTERMLAEVDVAHRMGIEVFVMDTGWYEKTGDWEVSHKRFPEGLKPIRERLDQYGMKLGLWFNPTAAGISSRMYGTHKSAVRSWKGQPEKPAPIWETEESYPMCLVSSYADAFADELIRVAREYGVRYFKWDAIGQYGCDSPEHLHGTAANTREERADSYAFQLPLAMARVVRKVTEAYPDAIVDFDVTESGRAFGLGFLSAGKYFLINNGPYLFNYDLPIDKERQNWNLFFYPGPARTWICRTPLAYDRWIPSVLLLTHYLPDDPKSSQMVNVASLVLGQNGIWGDLPKVSAEGVGFISTVLGKYKQVREDMAGSFPVRSGAVAGTPEIHEKILEESGRGGVVAFASKHARFTYVTQGKPVRNWWASEGAEVRFDDLGHAVISADTSEGAALVFFGAR
ncbi:MAG: alpha-galactosidase [Bryobacteraceae bacterium]